MQRTYGVVWREGASEPATGKLELLTACLRLDGRDGSREIPYSRVTDVHVGRLPAERLDGRPSIVLEELGRPAVTITTVSQTGLVGEIAELLVGLQLDAAAQGDEPDGLSFLPTPGPGDSDGGDIF
jgi:hypothetical protein